MASVFIKIEKDDVKTTRLGENIMIQCKNNIGLVFTPEALDELLNDYSNINELKH